MSVQGNITLVGDYGNPSGTGFAKLVLPELPDEAHATLEAREETFHAALVTAQLTGTAQGEVGVTYGDDSTATAPGASINIDRKLVVTWGQESDNTPRRMTISGVPVSSTGLSMEAAGERLNATGKAALASALNAMYAISDAVVFQGKVIQKS